MRVQVVPPEALRKPWRTPSASTAAQAGGEDGEEYSSHSLRWWELDWAAVQ
jgi:hypothetical protein